VEDVCVDVIVTVLVAGVSVVGTAVIVVVVVVGSTVVDDVTSCVVRAAADNSSSIKAGIVDASFFSSSKPSISVTWSNLALIRDSLSSPAGHRLHVLGHTCLARYSCFSHISGFINEQLLNLSLHSGAGACVVGALVVVVLMIFSSGIVVSISTRVTFSAVIVEVVTFNVVAFAEVVVTWIVVVVVASVVVVVVVVVGGSVVVVTIIVVEGSTSSSGNPVGLGKVKHNPQVLLQYFVRSLCSSGVSHKLTTLLQVSYSSVHTSNGYLVTKGLGAVVGACVLEEEDDDDPSGHVPQVFGHSLLRDDSMMLPLQNFAALLHVDS